MSKFNKPVKSLGQNFLTNQSIGIEMVRALQIAENDIIVEIGGGRGAITTLISEKIQNKPNTKLIVYEIDQDLGDYLAEKYKKHININVLITNFLDDQLPDRDKWKLIGAIPYYITSPIIHKFLNFDSKHRPEIVLLLVQKEVGEKLINKAPDASYWSNITYGYNVRKLLNVSKDSFNPIPKVESMVVLFEKDEIKSEIIDEIGFLNWSKFLHHGYKNPRKMLNKQFDKDILEKADIDPTLRPQNISPEKWIELYKKLKT